MDKHALFEHIGHLGQVGGIRRLKACEGPENGLEVLQVRTGKLEFEVLPSRGMDIGAAFFRGQSLTWLSHAGFAHPNRCEENGVIGWLRAFGGGLLTTCGLSNVGRPCVEDGVEYGQHGRASSTPATEVLAWGQWLDGQYQMSLQGKTTEAYIYGPKLEKTRLIRTYLGQSQLEISDTVENLGSSPCPLMILYHFNLGWPLIDRGSSVQLPSQSLEVVEGSAAGWERLDGPSEGWVSSVLEHRLQVSEDGWIHTLVQGGGMRLEVAYEASTLPRFTQWRQLGKGDYVMGLEPGNVGVRGRVWERANGSLPILGPGQRQTFRLRIAVEPIQTQP